MKKGKVLNLVVGTLDILFSLFLFTTIILGLFFTTNLVSDLFLGFGSLFLDLGGNISTIDHLRMLEYIFFTALGVVGLLSLIFGSVTVSKARKDQKRYYKGGSLITFAIFETLGLAFFITLLLYNFSLIPAIIVGVFAVIVILRYVAIGLLYCGKKKYISETPVS